MPKQSTDQKYGLVLASPFLHPRKSADLERFSKMIVDDISSKDAVLLMWVTLPTLQDGLYLMTEWNFYFQNAFCFKSIIPGQPRLLLVSTHKDIPSQIAKSKTSAIIVKLKEDQSTSDDICGVCESLYPKRRKLILFAKETRSGWDSLPE